MTAQGRRSQPPKLRSDERRALLEQGALSLGEHWSQCTCDHLRKEGRRIVGGWPGTLSEARARAHAYCDAELRRERMSPLTYEEREKFARSAYAHARNAWLSKAVRGELMENRLEEGAAED